MLSPEQFGVLPLTLWREARGEGHAGMAAVCAVIMNRVAKHGSTPEQECLKPLQFSSMTAPGDPERNVYPSAADPSWVDAQEIASNAEAKLLVDPTDGATLYYAPRSIEQVCLYTLPSGQKIAFPPHWNPHVVQYTVTIGHHVFFREVV